VLCIRRVWDCVNDTERQYSVIRHTIRDQLGPSPILAQPASLIPCHVISCHSTSVLFAELKSSHWSSSSIDRTTNHDGTTDSPHHTYPNRVRSSLAFSYPRFLSGSDMHRLGTPESTLLLTCITKTAMQKFTVETAQVNITPVSRRHMTKPWHYLYNITNLEQLYLYDIKERSSRIFTVDTVQIQG
jgi:hypothetical protein